MICVCKLLFVRDDNNVCAINFIVVYCINCNKNGRNAFHYFVIDHLAELFPNATKIQKQVDLTMKHVRTIQYFRPLCLDRLFFVLNFIKKCTSLLLVSHTFHHRRKHKKNLFDDFLMFWLSMEGRKESITNKSNSR